jgi:hypothetical protein
LAGGEGDVIQVEVVNVLTTRAARQSRRLTTGTTEAGRRIGANPSDQEDPDVVDAD